MPRFYWNETSGAYEADCSTNVGANALNLGYWVCDGADEAACVWPSGGGTWLFVTIDGAEHSSVVSGQTTCADFFEYTEAGGPVSDGTGTGLLPDLTLEEGGLIATAIFGLWACAFAFRVIKRQLEES